MWATEKIEHILRVKARKINVKYSKQCCQFDTIIIGISSTLHKPAGKKLRNLSFKGNYSRNKA